MLIPYVSAPHSHAMGYRAQNLVEHVLHVFRGAALRGSDVIPAVYLFGRHGGVLFQFRPNNSGLLKSMQAVGAI